MGIHVLGHDIGIAVLERDGSPVFIAEEERWSRTKGGSFFLDPQWVIETLHEFGVSAQSIERLAVANIPPLAEAEPKTLRSGEPRLAHADAHYRLVSEIITQLPHLGDVQLAAHHRCHAAAAFITRPTETATTIVVLDGKGETESGSIWEWQGDRLAKLEGVDLPASLGKFFHSVAKWAGLSGVEREGKLMALAALGKPTRIQLIKDEILFSADSGCYELADPMRGIAWSQPAWDERLRAVLGPKPSTPEAAADVAASAQEVLTECVLRYCQRALRLTGHTALAISGGVAMNSAMNGRLREALHPVQIWIPPLASDTGVAFGAAASAVLANRGPTPIEFTPYLGSEITREDATQALQTHHSQLQEQKIEVTWAGTETKSVTDILARGGVVALAYGRSEVGPRALGHRSLIARADQMASRDRLNAAIKLREAWRPFAPMVHQSSVHDLFGFDFQSPYMTQAIPCADPSSIAAAVHLDGTARVQTVEQDTDPFLEGLLSSIGALAGTPALVNTSLNVQGEPIVRTCEEAIRLFVTRPVDALYLNGWLLARQPSSRGLKAGRGPVSQPPDGARILELQDGLLTSVDLGLIRDHPCDSWAINLPVPPSLMGSQLPNLARQLQSLGRVNVELRFASRTCRLGEMAAVAPSLAEWFATGKRSPHT